MTLNDATMCLLLLVGHSFTSVSSSLCDTNEDMSRCICNAGALINVLNLMPCLSAKELELRNGTLDVIDIEMQPALEVLPAIGIHKLIFSNVNVSFGFFSALISVLPLSKVVEVSMASSTIQAPQGGLPLSQQLSKVKTLQLEDVLVDSTLLSVSFQSLHQWLLGPLRTFSLVRVNLTKIDCYWVMHMRNLVQLDLSGNHLSEASLAQVSSCYSSPASLQSITSLELRDNKLTSFQALCGLLHLMPALKTIDVSGNNFSTNSSLHCLQAAKALRVLNISNSELTEAGSLFPTWLEVLDLSNNALETIGRPPQGLKKLYLSNNRLKSLPPLNTLNMLEVLIVDQNNLTALLNGPDGVSHGAFENLKDLRAGGNPYHCDCAVRETVLFLKTTHVTVDDWPEGFECVTPADQQGTLLMDLPLPGRCEQLESGSQRAFPSLITLYLLLALNYCHG